MYKVLIVDDEPLMQVGIKSMIDWESMQMELLALASNGEIALSIIEKEMPDIVICDIKMPIMSGLELIKICCERYGYGRPVFIFLTSYEEFSLAKEAIAYQACDYLVKLELTKESLHKSLEKAKTLVKTAPATKAEEDGSKFRKNEEKFYIRLLQNMFESKEQFQLQSSYLSISLDAPAYQCTYLEFQEENNKDLSDEKKFALYSSSFSLLGELLPKYLDAKLVSLDVKHCAILLEHSKEDGADSKPSMDTIHDTFAKLNDSIHRYYNIHFMMGIGTRETNPMEISASYQAARQAFSHATRENPIVDFEQLALELEPHETFNLSLFRDELSHSLDEFDEEGFRKVIDDLCKLFLENPNHTTQAMDASCSILYMVISSLPGGEATVEELFSEYPDNYRCIYRKRTTEQIIDWLKIFADKIAGYFADRKNNHTNYTVNMVKQYIHDHATEKLNLNDVSSMFNITPNYLSQLFKKYNDVGFNEYITGIKIAKAKEMLAEGQMKIYEISDALGFESSFYFSKVFKKMEGISPKDYANQRLT